jgi:type III secretory pathway component EscT
MDPFQIVILGVELLIGLVVGCAIPFCFRVSRELGEIKSTLEARQNQEQSIDGLEREVSSIKVRLARIGNGSEK